MKEQTKKILKICGATLAAILLMSGIVLSWFNGTKNTISSNDLGIGAFSNLDSFDNNGFNKSLKIAGKSYLELYKGDNNYFVNKDKKELELKTSQYSDDGREYVDMLKDYFSTNDILMSAGFQVANAIQGVVGDFDGLFTDKEGIPTKYADEKGTKDKAFILLDDSTLSTIYENVSSVSFAAEGAGYLAAQLSYGYTIYDSAVNKKENPNIVMWGGKAFPTVYNYMSGFAQGITELNDKHIGKNINGFEIPKVTLWSGGLDSSDVMDNTNSYAGDTGSDSTDPDADKTWYSGGFAANSSIGDGSIAKIKTDNAIKSNASIVFPIAGGNTLIAESELSNAQVGTTTKLIGVDTDATISSSKDELYLASAQKNLVDGAIISLWGMDDYDNDGIRNFSEKENENDPLEEKFRQILKDWQDDEVKKGLQLEGTLTNGGVKVIFGSDTSSGGNPALTKALEWFGKDESSLKKYLDEISNTVGKINNSDSNFTNMT